MSESYTQEPQSIDCPFCGETIEILVDPDRGGDGDGKTDWIEDCEVCCRPIQFSAWIEDGSCLNLEAKRSV